MKNIIYGPDEKPISEVNNKDLPLGIQAFIENRVEDKLADVREDLRKELASKRRYSALRFLGAFLISAGITLLLWLYGPAEVKEWTRKFVAENMNKPMLEEAANEAIRTKMADYVTEKVEPLRSKADDLSTRIDQLNSEITEKQRVLKDQIHIQQLAIDSKAGIRKNYEELKHLAEMDSDSQPYAKAALKEVELYYDTDRGQISYQHLVDPVSLEDPGCSVDEVVCIFKGSPELREAAVNTMSELKRKTVVQELCQDLDSEQNLRVVARITRTLEILTGQRFNPLAADTVNAWWRKNMGLVEYQSPYKEYCDVQRMIVETGGIGPNRAIAWIPLLDKVISSDADALGARCLRGELLAFLGRLEEAEEEFQEVEKRKSDYRWLYYRKANLLAKQGKKDAAMESLDKAVAKSPTLESDVKLEKLRLGLEK